MLQHLTLTGLRPTDQDVLILVEKGNHFLYTRQLPMKNGAEDRIARFWGEKTRFLLYDLISFWVLQLYHIMDYLYRFFFNGLRYTSNINTKKHTETE